MKNISAQVSFVFTKESVCAVFGMSIIYSSKLFKSKKRTLFIFYFFLSEAMETQILTTQDFSFNNLAAQ